MNINHISVSRKKCFDTCQQQYKYRYHLKVPAPGEEPFYFTYGSIVHRVAELYVEHGGELSVGELGKGILSGKYDLDEEGTKAVSSLPEDYQKKFPKHLKAIENLTKRVGMEGIVEHPFYYDLDPPNGRHIKGFIDRLIIKGDKAWIIDYKTTKKGKWRVNSETVKDDLQLRAYARVVQREFGLKAANIKAALFYLDGENLIGCCYSEESLAQVENDLREAYIQIEGTDPDKVWGKVGWHCKTCDYGAMCSFYMGQSAAEASFDGDMSSMSGGGW